MQTTTITVKVPARFYNDHEERELPSGTVIKGNSHRITVELDKEELHELLSDARYYSDPHGPYVDAALRRSAQRTVKILEAHRPQFE